MSSSDAEKAIESISVDLTPVSNVETVESISDVKILVDPVNDAEKAVEFETAVDPTPVSDVEFLIKPVSDTEKVVESISDAESLIDNVSDVGTRIDPTRDVETAANSSNEASNEAGQELVNKIKDDKKQRVAFINLIETLKLAAQTLIYAFSQHAQY